MAIHPDAIVKDIPPGSNDPGIVPIGMIFHVRDGEGDSLYNYFKEQSGGVEAHFYNRYDGTLEQYRDTEYEADANFKANSFVRNGVRYGFISVETEGTEHGLWTPEQLERNIDLMAWQHATHDTPLRVSPGPMSAGFGFHTLFDSWTPFEKSCPGPKRIKQFYEVMVPWLEQGGQLDMLTAKDFWSYWNKQAENRGDAYQLLRNVVDFVTGGHNRHFLNHKVRLQTNGDVEYSANQTTVGGILSSNNYYGVLGYYKAMENSKKLDILLSRQRVTEIDRARTHEVAFAELEEPDETEENAVDVAS